MRRILISLLCVMMLAITPAFAEDYSAMSVDDLHKIQSDVRAELLKRDLVLDGKTLLFESNGVTVYLTGDYEISWTGDFQLNVIVINESDKKISVTPDGLQGSINGWDVSCTSLTEVAAGKKLKGYFTFDLEDADVTSPDQIEEIELRVYLYDKDNWERICTIDPITIQFPIK